LTWLRERVGRVVARADRHGKEEISRFIAGSGLYRQP